MAVRAQAKEIRATARSRLVALSSVLDWNGDGDEPILVCECKKALKQETPYSRLLHTWTCVQVASGLPKDAARNSFNGTVWLTLKQNPACKHDLAALVQEKFKEWVSDSILRLAHESETPIPESKEVILGAASIPANTPTMPAERSLEHPGFHGDNSCFIREYIKEASPPSKIIVGKELHWETYDDFATKAAVFARSQAARGQSEALLLRSVSWDEQFMAATQVELVELRRAQALHALWSSGLQGRPPLARCEKESELEVCRYYAKLWMERAEEREDVLFVAASDEDRVVAQHCRMRWTHMIAGLGRIMRSLSQMYRKATSQHRAQRAMTERKIHRCHAVTHMDPNSIYLSMHAAVENVRLAAELGKHFTPLNSASLYILADRFLARPAMTLTEVLLECRIEHSCEPNVSYVNEIIAVLPVICIDYDSGGSTDRIVFFSLEHPDSAEGLASALLSCDSKYRQVAARSGDEPDGDHDVPVACSNIDGDGEFNVEGEDDAYWTRRVENKYGEQFLEFIHSYIFSRGALHVKDKSRMRDRLEAFTAPLTEIAKAATDAGYPISRSGVYNLFAPKRSNSINTTQRGVVQARPASVRKIERHWHPRSCFSGNRVKMAKQFVHQTQEMQYGKACQINLDAMKKTPIFISAGGPRRAGYAVLDKTGKATIPNLDHDFPLTDRFSLALSGVVKCSSLRTDASRQRDAGRSSAPAKTLRPTSMTAFIRPTRYQMLGSHANQHDLRRAFQLDVELQEADVLFVVLDNGGDYSLDISFNQHCYGRFWREQQLAWLGVAAYAPGDSAYNWEIESQWAKPRRKLIGHQLGRSAVDDDRQPLQGFDNPEDAYRRIAAAAVREFHDLLSTCKTGDNVWHVEAPLDEYPLLEDYALIRKFYDAGPKQCLDDCFAKLREEAADLQAHMEKTPSFIQFRFCIGANPCRSCAEVLRKKRGLVKDWNPADILRLLRFNNYWLPVPELRKDCMPPVDAVDEVADAVETENSEHVSDPRLPDLRKQMVDATNREDYLKAHEVKFAIRAILAEAHRSMPFKCKMLPTTPGAIWTNHVDQSPYKSWAEFLSDDHPQDTSNLLIPVVGNSRRLEQVLHCNVKSCRYVAKTPTELQRHETHWHHGMPDLGSNTIVQASAPGLLGYSLDEAVPILSSKVKRHKFGDCDVADVVMEEDPPEGEAIVSEPMGGAGGLKIALAASHLSAVVFKAESEPAACSSRVAGPKVHFTEVEKVRDAICHSNFNALLADNIKILWSNSVKSWRGFKGGEYIIGTNATVKKFATDEAAIKHVYDCICSRVEKGSA